MKSVEEQMQKIISDYYKKVEETAEDSFNNVGEAAAKMLRRSSPRKTGKYARGWSIQKSKRLGEPVIVYNKVYQLTHLLEHGHISPKTGMRVGQKVHIKPVEEWANNEVMVRIERGLE